MRRRSLSSDVMGPPDACTLSFLCAKNIVSIASVKIVYAFHLAG